MNTEFKQVKTILLNATGGGWTFQILLHHNFKFCVLLQWTAKPTSGQDVSICDLDHHCPRKQGQTPEVTRVYLTFCLRNFLD